MECICSADKGGFWGLLEDQFQPDGDAFGMIQKYDRAIFSVIPDLMADFLNGLIC